MVNNILGSEDAAANNSSLLNGKMVQLQGMLRPSVCMPEAGDVSESSKHWSELLNRGENAMELVSSSRRLDLNRSSPNEKGLSALVKAFLARDLREKGNPFQVGSHQIKSIQLEPAASSDDNLLAPKNFRVEYTLNAGRPNEEHKVLKYSLGYTPYDGRQLDAAQLHEVLRTSNELRLNPGWLTRTKGIGRPSAFMVAQRILDEIASGAIQNDTDLTRKVKQWREQGRAARGSLFVNTSSQFKQLIELGKQYLKVGSTDREVLLSCTIDPLDSAYKDRVASRVSHVKQQTLTLNERVEI